MIIKTFQVGDKFNGLTISSSIYKTMIESGNKRRFWLCDCECGKQIWVATTRLIKGTTKSCGCYRWNKNHIHIGDRFDKLTIIDFSHKNEPHLSNVWKCRCDCGKEILMETTQLFAKRNKIISCGSNECVFQRGFDDISLSAKRSLMTQYKINATKRKMEFNLNENEFITLTSDNCYYCGIQPLQRIKNNKSIYIYNGIDRIDNQIGYNISNTVTCCKQCNYAKRNMSSSDFYNWIQKIYKNLSNKRILCQ